MLHTGSVDSPERAVAAKLRLQILRATPGPHPEAPRRGLEGGSRGRRGQMPGTGTRSVLAVRTRAWHDGQRKLDHASRPLRGASA